MVGDQHFHWVAGESRIFDDTNEHEVWNESEEERVVLMIQFDRPLRSPGRQVSRLFREVLKRTPFVTVAHENQRAFEKRLEALVQTAP